MTEEDASPNVRANLARLESTVFRKSHLHFPGTFELPNL
jgi:hypothetical protein